MPHYRGPAPAVCHDYRTMSLPQPDAEAFAHSARLRAHILDEIAGSCWMPFSRYMHIVTEALLILFRNAGLKVRKPRKGFAEAEIYSCSSCGLCLDACPMNVQKKNIRQRIISMISVKIQIS